MHVAIAAIGIIMEFVKKSKKSRIDMPNIFTKSRALNPNAQAVPNTRIMTAMSAQHFFLLQPS